MRLTGKVALVTGASRGIGKAIALAFAREGADIVINCSTSVKTAKEVTKEIINLGRRSMVIQADVTDKSAVDEMIEKTVAEFGGIDIMVNNAGIAVVGASAELEEERWRRGIDVMFNGVFYCSQAAGKHMIKQKSGKIINIASINGIGAFPERVAYGSAKAGVMHITRTLGSEWAPYNINVNAIAPGYIKTSLVTDLITQGRLDEQELVNRTPAGRLGECEDVANTAVFLASEESKYIIGQTIVVDGGWSVYMYIESWLEKSRDNK